MMSSVDGARHRLLRCLPLSQVASVVDMISAPDPHFFDLLTLVQELSWKKDCSQIYVEKDGLSLTLEKRLRSGRQVTIRGTV